MPAARSARAKWTILSASREGASVRVPSAIWPLRLLCCADLRAHLIEQLLGLAALDARDVVLVFQQHAERIVDGRGIEGGGVELGQRGGPIKRLGNAGRLEQVLPAQR